MSLKQLEEIPAGVSEIFQLLFAAGIHSGGIRFESLPTKGKNEKRIMS
jgi:hypothetical protein